ncbi:hypothetical protein PYW08_012689 [Mythimna loreyi]|uniref:Uncharacterized protein n=1 Tax=Mythimna loreyi TaxID=667449 RepID=A0ACC2Q1G0_9NEOP|nr:hypothetical protein PYW08_012689 [Mythimna loreyi]
MYRVQCVLVMALFSGLVNSWDIAVSAGDRIEFHNIDGTMVLWSVMTDTVRFPSQNLTALAYDEVHNTLHYIDKQSGNDTICGYNITFLEYQCYIERNGRNIQGLAFDPVTEKLFFTDTKERSINWFSFKPGSKNNVFGNLLLKMDDSIPTDIIVDSCRGYIYWINTNISPSTIERARFDGSDREVIIKATSSLNLHSLAIDQQTQKIFWIEPQALRETKVYSADLNGKNWQSMVTFIYTIGTLLYNHPNTLTVLKENLFAMVDWCTPCNKNIWTIEKAPLQSEKVFRVNTDSFVGIVANYKMKDQFHATSDCKNISICNDEIHEPFKIARENEFCVHGIKVIGQSICKCTARYTGVRCEASVCDNYCLQGSCSFTEDGLPECRCNAGYSGERCELNVCNGYCLNNGTCSLNEEDEPMCECVGAYEGHRCEVLAGVNNCDGNVNEEFDSTCQCAGSRRSSGLETDTNNTVSTTSSYYIEEREKKLTLVELLDNWRQQARHFP